MSNDRQKSSGPVDFGGIRPTVRGFIRGPESEEVVRQCLRELGVSDPALSTGDIGTAVSVLAHEPIPRLLIVDVSDIDDLAIEIDKLAQVCQHSAGIIAIGDRNDVNLYRDLQRAGVAEYFVKPLPGDLVTQACRSILSGSFQPERKPSGKLVFVLGVRGGSELPRLRSVPPGIWQRRRSVVSYCSISI